jgi:hypothetical protein
MTERTERCPDTGEVAALASLPAGDPRRRHLENCPRCRALAHAFAEFEDPGDSSDLPGLAEADTELRDRLVAALAAEPVRLPQRRRRSWLAAAAAAIAICAIGLAADDLLHLRDGSSLPVGERLRGDGEAVDLDWRTTADGWRLTWSDAPAADAVVFVFYDASLNEIGRRSATGSGIELARTDPVAAAVFCQGFAVAQGDTLLRTPILKTRSAHRPNGE